MGCFSNFLEMQAGCNAWYQVYRFLCFVLDEIQSSVMIFSSAGHNKEHFQAYDPLWVEALFSNKEKENMKNNLFTAY